MPKCARALEVCSQRAAALRRSRPAVVERLHGLYILCSRRTRRACPCSPLSSLGLRGPRGAFVRRQARGRVPGRIRHHLRALCMLLPTVPSRPSPWGNLALEARWQGAHACRYVDVLPLSPSAPPSRGQRDATRACRPSKAEPCDLLSLDLDGRPGQLDLLPPSCSNRQASRSVRCCAPRWRIQLMIVLLPVHDCAATSS